MFTWEEAGLLRMMLQVIGFILAAALAVGLAWYFFK